MQLRVLEGKVYCPPTNKTQRIWIPLPVLSEGNALEYLKISNDGKYYSKFPKTDGQSKGTGTPHSPSGLMHYFRKRKLLEEDDAVTKVAS